MDFKALKEKAISKYNALLPEPLQPRDDPTPSTSMNAGFSSNPSLTSTNQAPSTPSDATTSASSEKSPTEAETEDQTNKEDDDEEKTLRQQWEEWRSNGRPGPNLRMPTGGELSQYLGLTWMAAVVGEITREIMN